MTEPKMVQAMEYLDDELIVAAAEEKKAAPRLTKKKVLALLAACFLMLITFATMGTAPRPAWPTEEDNEAAWLAYMDYQIEMYQDDPEMLAYYTKWREVDFELLDPWPDEWKNPDGSYKDFVTIEMIEEVYEGSLLQEYDFSNPEVMRGRDPKVEFFFSDNRLLFSATSFLG